MKHTLQVSDRIPKVLLWGGKTKARIIDEMLRESNAGKTTLVFDHTLEAATFETDALFVNNIAALKKVIHSVTHYVVCMGGEHGYARCNTAKYLDKIGLKPITLIHHKSFIEPTASIDEGCQIMPCAVVHKFAKVSKHTIINTNATIDHECVIGKGVHIMGSVAIAGKVVIKDYATIGTNATVLPFLEIGEGAFVGAGAVVTKDIPPYSVVTGIPAKHVRENAPKFNEDMLKKLIKPERPTDRSRR